MTFVPVAQWKDCNFDANSLSFRGQAFQRAPVKETLWEAWTGPEEAQNTPTYRASYLGLKYLGRGFRVFGNGV